MKTHGAGDLIAIKANVNICGDTAVFNQGALRNTSKSIELLSKILQATGPYLAGDQVCPQEGSCVVEVARRGDPEDYRFDIAGFFDLCRKIREIISIKIDALRPNSDIDERSLTLAAQFHCDNSLIRRVLVMIVSERYPLCLLDVRGQEIDLSSRFPKCSLNNEQCDIDVAEREDFVRVETSRGTYRFGVEEISGLQVGDQVVIEKVGPAEQRNCIRAARATLVRQGDLWP